MVSGIDSGLREAFLKRIQATDRFWELSKHPYMFVKQDFHAVIYVGEKNEQKIKLSRPDEDEDWPEKGTPYYYVNCFKPHAIVIELFFNTAKKLSSKTGVFPVNLYAWGRRIDGPYIHNIEIMKTFTPRNESDHWIHGWPQFNSGQCFFVDVDAKWAVFTSKSSEPDSNDFLLCDKDFLEHLKKQFPEIINFIHR